jgi:sulfatase modifying factor 1
VASNPRLLVAFGACIALQFGCNAILGIEEGILAPDAGEAGGSGGSAADVSVGTGSDSRLSDGTAPHDPAVEDTVNADGAGGAGGTAGSGSVGGTGDASQDSHSGSGGAGGAGGGAGSGGSAGSAGMRDPDAGVPDSPFLDSATGHDVGLDSADEEPPCIPNTVQCVGNSLRTCQVNGQWDHPKPCDPATPYCLESRCTTPLSCANLEASVSNCGPTGDSCCTSPFITGGTYSRSNDINYPATISDFRLDKYEITVARFREFLSAGRGTRVKPPEAGSGAHPKIAGSGWDSAWETSLVAAGLAAAVKCDATYGTWTDVSGPNENKPINCITWFEAFAFCIWDGGRLPTEAEWNYAAAGGDVQREYPWGFTVPAANAALAVHGCYYNALDAGTCSSSANIAPVGSVPAGNGRWGQADLAGNLMEMNLDANVWPYQMPCNDCANLGSEPEKVNRGGAFDTNEKTVRSAFHNGYQPSTRRPNLGARCARTP